jgi:hypothetical protein
MQISPLLKINLNALIKVFSQELFHKPRFADLPSTSQNQGLAAG